MQNAAIAVNCPFCERPAGMPCRTRSFKYVPRDLDYFHEQREQAVLKSAQSVVEQFQPQRSRHATLGKFCECGHGVGSHRSSTGARATYCRQCPCAQYERDYNSGRDWNLRNH